MGDGCCSPTQPTGRCKKPHCVAGSSGETLNGMAGGANCCGDAVIVTESKRVPCAPSTINLGNRSSLTAPSCGITPELSRPGATTWVRLERIVSPQARAEKVYRPRTRHATNKRPKPTIQDQVATGSGIFARPKWATRAMRKRTRETTHTAIVGALPELRMTFPLVALNEETRLARGCSMQLQECCYLRPNAMYTAKPAK